MTAAVLTGVQEPRFIHRPTGVVSSSAGRAIEFCAEIGMPLDPWQQIVLETMLGRRVDGSWAAEEFGLICARQNGKSAVLEARELAGLFLFDEPRIVHSAHQAATADEAFKRMRNLIESVPWLDSEVAKILASPGRQSIHMKNGAELSYRTRTKGGARGFSAPTVIFDEAQELSGEQFAAIVPVTSSFKQRQLVLTGTVLAGAAVLEGVVRRGRDHIGTDLGYTEWSAPEDADSDDPEAIRQANPAIGYRKGLTVQYFLSDLERFRSALAEDKYREERLSIWPALGGIGTVIPIEPWQTKCLTEWRPPEDVRGGVVAVAVSMNRKYACVGYAVPGDGRPFGEIVAQTDENRPGIDWVLAYLTGLQSRRGPTSVVVDKAGPAFPLVNAMIAAGLPVRVAEFADWKSACAQAVDRVVTGQVAHPGQVQLTESAQGVQWRLSGDAQVFDRKTPNVLVAPIEAWTLAVWGLVGSAKRPSKYESEDLLVL